MEVAKITEEKANEIRGTQFAYGRVYNPVKDKNDNWIISIRSARYLHSDDYDAIEFEPKEDVDEPEEQTEEAS